MFYAPPDGDLFVPFAANWPKYTPTPHRLGELQSALSSTPAGLLLMALVSRHFDEVTRIVNSARKVAAAWHRMQGPLLLRTVVGWEGGTLPPVPAVVGGRPVAEGLGRLLRALERYASPLLLHDLRRYRALVVALPGASLWELDFNGDETHAGTTGHS